MTRFEDLLFLLSFIRLLNKPQGIGIGQRFAFVSVQGDRIAACLRGQVGWEPLKSRDFVSANFS